ncbi:MAG: efflux RND transporter periplasmic adaptor subunit [Synergistaceae bacterium]|nr:efflux RND transporter periplasmic adaptor subunit [Synergistaceae bacterium]
MKKQSQRKPDRSVKDIVRNILYTICFALIVAGWIYAFRSYFSHYDSLHPEIAWAVPWVQEDVIEAGGIFLWNEVSLSAPIAGTVRFPRGTGPFRVEKGAVVARVSSGSRASDVKAPGEGYFVAGVDGFEDRWRYSDLWPGESELPSVPKVGVLKDGAGVQSGAPIGKIVIQPQELRFIGYADLTGNLEEHLASNRVMVKMDALDTPSRANVRVYEKIGHRVKMYLNLPWFPPDLILSRNYKLIIGAGEMSGVTIPETAVTNRNGRRGAFVLRGSSSHFLEVRGRVIDGGKFLVTEGLKLGDAVIVDADAAREGRVKLW